MHPTEIKKDAKTMTTETGVDAPTAKDVVRAVLNRLPDNASLGDIMYELYVEEKIAQGLKDAASGNWVTQDEARALVAKWRKSAG